MTIISNKITILKSTLIAGLLGVGFMGAVPTSADAMVLHNCTAKTLYVRLRGQNTRTIDFLNTNIRSGTTVFPDVSRSQKYQMVIGAGNSRKTYSGWGATEELSLRTISGNTEVSRGNYCPQVIDPPVTPPIGGGGNHNGCLMIGNLRICHN